MRPGKELEVIREVMEEDKKFCQYEYMPDEDGWTYTCGDDEDVEFVYTYGLLLCLEHRLEYR